MIAKNLLNQDFPKEMVVHGDAEIATKEIVEILVQTAEKEFLQSIRPVGSQTTFPWNVTVVENPMVNAYCAPGGTIVVFSGLIDFCVEAEHQRKIDNAAAAICGVLAHEISHGVLRHGMETMSWMPPLLLLILSIQVFLISIGLGPDETRFLTRIFQEIINFFLQLPHSRSVESEADLLGSELLLKSGFPVEDYPRVLSLLQNGNSEWFSTHPAPERRALAIQKHLQEATTQPDSIVPVVRTDLVESIRDAHYRFVRFSHSRSVR